MPDLIRLVGLQFYAYHGVDPGERELGQRFELDIELRCDLAAAGRSDDLAGTVNYREVYELVAACMEPPCLLLEAVAERVAGRVLARFAVESVQVRVRKPAVPIGGVLAHAEVVIERAALDGEPLTT